MAPERPERVSLTDRVVQNAETVAALVERAEQAVEDPQRRIERVTNAIGLPRTIVAVAVACLAWMTLNTTCRLVGLRALDPPPFIWLQGAVGLACLFTTMVVLATQKRQQRHADDRALLELQINLLAEQKAAKIIALLEELRRDLPLVRDRTDQEAEAMQRPVDPHGIVSVLEKTLESHADGEEPRGSR